MALVDRDIVIKEIGGHFPTFQKVIFLAWEQWLSIPLEFQIILSPRSRASMVHDFMVAQAATHLPDAVFHDVQGMKLFLLGNYAIRFKLLDETLQSKNHPSKQVELFRSQQQIEGISAVHNLEAGYQLDSIRQNIADVYLVCPNEKSIYWDIKLGDEHFGKDRICDMFPVDPNRHHDDTEEVEPITYKKKQSAEILPIKRHEQDT